MLRPISKLSVSICLGLSNVVMEETKEVFFIERLWITTLTQETTIYGAVPLLLEYEKQEMGNPLDSR